MADENLPPFGIRGLCSPEKQFSVLQISERQYDASLHSYPDSALTWLDEDDGELVTIGSGSELKERLNDPIPHTNPRIRYHDRLTGRLDDRYIHLFDISGSQTSLDVWKEHEAYFSKTQSSPSESVISIPKTDDVNSQGVKTDAGSISDFEVLPEQDQSTSEISQQSEAEDESKEINTVLDIPSQTSSVTPVRSFGFQLDHLAGFLHGTSEVLRKAAAKTREYETSPIEDILSGMTTVLGEVGAFGLDLIDNINESNSTAAPSPAIDVATTVETPISSDDAQSMDHSLAMITDNYLRAANGYLKSLKNSDAAPMSTLGNNGDSIETTYHDLVKDQGVVDQLSELRSRVGAYSVWERSERQQLQDIEHQALVQLLAVNRLEASHALAEQEPLASSKKYLDQAAQQRSNLFKLLQDVWLLHRRASLPNSTQSPAFEQCLEECLVSDTDCAPVNSTQLAILDQEVDALGAAFSVRYPPLMSLRRAKTVDVLRPETKSETASKPTVTFRQAHTGQPRPQVFDAETQRRRDFAKVCFPTQIYTPGLGATTVPLARPKSSICVTSEEINQPQAETNDNTSVHSHEFAEVLNGSLNEMSNIKSSETNSDSDSIRTRTSTSIDLPAVPETQETQLKAIMNQSPALMKEPFEPSREVVTGNERSGFGGHSDLLASHKAIHRLHRHRSLMNPGLKKPIPNGLHRSQTVTATNPSARLTGPFSPLFPAPVAPQSFSGQQTFPFYDHTKKVVVQPNEQQTQPFNFQPLPAFSHPVVAQDQSPPKPVTGPIRSLNRSASERRPRTVYEPYRSSNAHRAFEPVWEGQDEPTKETDPNPGVVIVDASNFEPGTTEQDIRDLLADDCRTVIGINTLISCRIIATEPKVLAKLVIKDKTNADAVIDKYNNRWVNGRPLKFEYARTGIDARINRIRGALPPLDLPQPRHLRSVPDLRKATKPPFPAFVHRAKPITTPILATQTKPSMPPTPLPSQPVLPPAFAGNLIHECETQLKNMGYGELDPALLNRLHVYACAAKGDVHEAIEMIEDDRKANDFDAFQKKIQLAREVRWGKHEADENDDASDDEAYNQELQEAIKLSMKEQ